MSQEKCTPSPRSPLNRQACREKMRWAARYVLICLEEYADDLGVCQVSIPDLARDTGLAIRTVKVILGELDAGRYLSRESMGPGKTYGTITLNLHREDRTSGVVKGSA